MPSSASASAPEPPAVAESSSRWRGCRLKADWGWSLPWGLYRIGSRTTPSLAVLGSPPASGGVWSSGAKNEKGRSRWNGIGLRGADGNRNHDLFDANEALYQLSYSPLDVALLRRTTQYTLIRPMSKCKPACVKIGCRLWADMRHCAWGASLGEPSPSDATERNQAGRAANRSGRSRSCSACRPPHSMSSPRYRASCRISP